MDLTHILGVEVTAQNVPNFVHQRREVSLLQCVDDGAPVLQELNRALCSDIYFVGLLQDARVTWLRRSSLDRGANLLRVEDHYLREIDSWVRDDAVIPVLPKDVRYVRRCSDQAVISED